MDRTAAIAAIVAAAARLEVEVEATKIEYYAEKFVADVLDYCHRADFPPALVYMAAELISRTLGGNEPVNAPLKKLTQNDTTFEWAVESVFVDWDSLFAKIKPRLNIYRKVVSL